MIYLKLIGGGLIVSAGGFAAYTMAHAERRRLTVLEAWIDLILFIRSQIDCYLMPLDEILSKSDEAILRACACRTPHPSLPSLLASSRSYLGEESGRLIASFVKEIGGSYREEQLRRCDYYITALRTERNKLAESLPSRIRLSVSLCLCASIGAFILLW